jgi:predicted nucleic acid-binding protein
LMNGNKQVPQPDLVVSNAGPLISLSTVSQLDLLKALFEQVSIPQAVYDEVVVHGEGEPGSQEVDEADWIEVCQVEDHLAVDLLREALDAGESEAIVLAQGLNAKYVILDDGLARRKARHIKLPMLGTLGVLLMAKEADLIPVVKPILDELRQTDFRMSDRVYQRVLAKAGER